MATTIERNAELSDAAAEILAHVCRTEFANPPTHDAVRWVLSTARPADTARRMSAAMDRQRDNASANGWSLVALGCPEVGPAPVPPAPLEPFVCPAIVNVQLLRRLPRTVVMGVSRSRAREIQDVVSTLPDLPRMRILIDVLVDGPDVIEAIVMALAA